MSYHSPTYRNPPSSAPCQFICAHRLRPRRNWEAAQNRAVEACVSERSPVKFEASNIAVNRLASKMENILTMTTGLCGQGEVGRIRGGRGECLAKCDPWRCRDRERWLIKGDGYPCCRKGQNYRCVPISSYSSCHWCNGVVTCSVTFRTTRDNLCNPLNSLYLEYSSCCDQKNIPSQEPNITVPCETFYAPIVLRFFPYVFIERLVRARGADNL